MIKLLQLICLFFLIICQLPLKTESDTTYLERYNNPVCCIAHFNFDCILDTLNCTQEIEGRWLPKLISWGYVDTLLCDSTTTLDSNNKTKTIFVYPDIEGIKISYSIVYFNQDSVSDIFLYLNWQTGDTSNLIDTSRIICIFGQNSLQKLDSIIISQVTSSQDSLFFARDVTLDYGLSNQKKFEPYGNSLYSLSKVVLYVNEDSPPSIYLTIKDRIDNNNTVVKVYPNPTINELNIDMSNLPSGAYEFEILNVLGESLFEKKIFIDQETFNDKIDITPFVDGYYYLLIKYIGIQNQIVNFIILK